MTQIQTEQITAKRTTSVKTYVLDTTILIDDPDIFSKLKGRTVVPLVVIGQLDGLKNNEDITVAQRARQASRAILETQKKGKVRVINNFKEGINVLNSEADNKIIGTCLTLKEQGENVNLLTTDVNMQITARSMGVKTKEVEDKRIKKLKVWKIITLCFYCLTMIPVIIEICKSGSRTPEEILEFFAVSLVMLCISAGITKYYYEKIYGNCSNKKDDRRNVINNPAFDNYSGNIWHKDENN